MAGYDTSIRVNTKVDNGHVIKLKLLELYDSEAIFTRVERDKY